MRSDTERLYDALDAIASIEKYAVRGREAFDQDELIRTWVLHHLRNLGEAVRGLSEAARALRPEVPWAKIVGMRHILVHQYFALDDDIVWTVVERELPVLKHHAQELLAELSSAADLEDARDRNTPGSPNGEAARGDADQPDDGR